MQDNLVIVESPAKAHTIEKFLGKGYKVMSSYGHIRDLKKKDISIEKETLSPIYEIPKEKQQIVKDLQASAKKAKTVWLASDEDREGEAISWHLQHVLDLDEKHTRRIVFHEITKNAILEAIEHPRSIDMNLVNAQQARRVLDRLVGFKLSPVLWRKVKPALSAGRVQSVAVRLIVEREREIQSFKPEVYFRVTALLETTGEDGSVQQLRSELDHKFVTKEEARAFLERVKKGRFTVEDVTRKPMKRIPAPPFTTSTLQQEAARKLGLSVGQTMLVAQHLYENGLITYMRTDSVNLSTLCINASRAEVEKLYGEEYSRPRNYHTTSRGAQEAHEAIRPTYMNRTKIEGMVQERHLYDLIWKRTLASQMADAQIEKTTVTIAVEGEEYKFVSTGEVILFDGFLKVYRESMDDEGETDETTQTLPKVKGGDSLSRVEMVATERTTQSPLRYTEASLVKKLEELGIGRPSTYAPTISTIQQREYVVKGDKKGTEHPYTILTLKDDKISLRTKKELVGKEKGKLLPTDVGMVVNDFLMENFPQIMDYNFTANVEEEFDRIAEGKLLWDEMMKDFWTNFSPEIDRAMNSRQEHKAGERALGVDPESGKTVFVKIGRFGPVVQMGEASDEEKPRFAQLPKGLAMDKVTLEEAMELFRLPRVVGQKDGENVVIGAGRFGPYIRIGKDYTSLPKEMDPLTVGMSDVETVLQQKREEESKRHVKTFEEDEKMEIMNGRYGPYIAYDGKNYRIPKKMHAKVADLTYEECKRIMEK